MSKQIAIPVFLITILLWGCNSKTVDKKEQSNNDSIKKYLELAGNDTLDFDKRIRYNDKAVSFINLEKNDSLTRYYLKKICNNSFKTNNWNSLKKNSHLLYEKSKKVNDSLNIANSYVLQGLYYTFQSKNDSALYYSFKAKEIYTKINSLKRLGRIYGDISLTQSYSCDFLGSNKTAIEGIKFSKKTRDSANLFYLYRIIATNLYSLKEYNASNNFNLKAIQYNKDISFKKITYSNIGINYLELKNYKLAKKHLLNVAYDKAILRKNPEAYCNALNYLGLLNIETNNLKSAFNFLNSSKIIMIKNNIDNGYNYNQLFYSKYYEKRNNINMSIAYAKRAVELSKSYKNPNDVLICLEQLIKVDKSHASFHAQNYIKLRDSLQIAERNFRDKFARIAYETDEITQEKNNAIQEKWIYTSISLFIILIVILSLIITWQRLKQKDLQLMQSQQQANEEIYQLLLFKKNREEQVRETEKKRIAKDLHDGVMNKLASTRLNLSALIKEKNDTAIKQSLKHISGIYQIEKEIRNISHDLNKETFEKPNNYSGLLDNLIKEQKYDNNPSYEFEANKEINWDKISGEIKMNLYRIIQEACNNINKHSHAQKAIICLILDDNNICLSITDDGIGFNPKIKKGGIGMQNIKYRVKSLKGKLTISSVPNQNTSINISIPLNKN